MHYARIAHNRQCNEMIYKILVCRPHRELFFEKIPERILLANIILSDLFNDLLTICIFNTECTKLTTVIYFIYIKYKFHCMRYIRFGKRNKWIIRDNFSTLHDNLIICASPLYKQKEQFIAVIIQS